jgi:predicted DNA-binding transcriptional regulator AlpA
MAKNKHKPVSAYDPDDRILTTDELLEKIPLTRVTLWRMSREGRFVKPIQLTSSRIGWRWSSVLAWLAEREKHPVTSREYFGRDKPPTEAADKA